MISNTSLHFLRRHGRLFSGLMFTSIPNSLMEMFPQTAIYDVDHPTSVSELFSQDERWALKHLPGYVVCSECAGVAIEGRLCGALLSYEYVREGRAMFGRIYYLQIDQRTFYSLHFTGAREKLQSIREQMDSIARSFHLKACPLFSPSRTSIDESVGPMTTRRSKNSFGRASSFIPGIGEVWLT